jgi:hypothetical protein
MGTKETDVAYNKGLCTVVPLDMGTQVLGSPKSLFTVWLSTSEGSVGLRKVATSVGMKMGFA